MTTRPIPASPRPAGLSKRLSRLGGQLVLTSLQLRLRLGTRYAPGRTLARACELFCTPLPGSRRRARSALMEGAQRSSLVVDGKRLAVYLWGEPANRPYVLLVHGWSSCAAVFEAWVEPLRRAGYAIVAFDQPAHGLSEGRQANLPAFASVIEAIVVRHGRPAALVGHSLGGAAVAVALSAGLRTQRAILISPAADLAAATQRFSRMMGLPDLFAQEMVASFEAGPVPIESLKAQNIGPKVKAKLLVLHDEQDREIPLEEGQRYAHCCPDAQLVTTSGLGHSRILTDERVISAGLSFLAGRAYPERIDGTGKSGKSGV